MGILRSGQEITITRRLPAEGRSPGLARDGGSRRSPRYRATPVTEATAPPICAHARGTYVGFNVEKEHRDARKKEQRDGAAV